MAPQTKFDVIQKSLAATCTLVVILSILGCALAGSLVESREATIQRLQAAKEKDITEATDNSVSPARQADCAAHAEMADLAVKKLQHGFTVQKWEIEEASEVPPKSVRAQKEQLLAELNQVRQQQLRNDKLNYGDNQVGLDRLREQEAQTSKVIEMLDIGEFVPWSDIVQALQQDQ